MESPINWKLITHPINWLIVLLMLVIAGTAGHLLLSLFGVEASTSNINPNLGVGQSNIGIANGTPAPSGSLASS